MKIRTGPPTIIDEHPKREQIIADLVKSESTLSGIARKYKIPREPVARYFATRLLPEAAIAHEKRIDKEGGAVIERIETSMARLQKMYDACDEYLSDPNNPEKYYLGPQSSDVDVVYETEEETSNGYLRTVKHRANLQDLLDKAMGKTEGEVVEIHMKQEDPRRLILKTAEVTSRHLELLAKIEGLVKENITNNITVNQNYLELKAIVLKVAEHHPELKVALAEALGADA